MWNGAEPYRSGGREVVSTMYGFRTAVRILSVSADYSVEWVEGGTDRHN